jgi:diguanylate cyclase (GGDEF)-like protein
MDGEEFIILMPDTDHNSAYQTMERLRDIVDETPLDTVDNVDILVTISAGIVNWNGDDTSDIHTLLDRADKALYISKETGRNRVTVWKET